MRRTAPVVLLALALAGCGGQAASTSSASGEPVRVSAGDTSCDVSRTSLPAGSTLFRIENTGSQVTEVYLYGEGDKIVAEKENIGPGISYDLTAQISAGSYDVVCKPGMTGDGIRTPITVAAGRPAP